MNVAPMSRRSLACLKNTMRHARQQRVLFPRTMATATEPTTSTPPPPASGASLLPSHNFFTVPDPKTKRIRTGFAVYSPPRTLPTADKINFIKTTVQPLPAQTLAATHPDPLPALRQKQISLLDPSGVRTALFSRSNRDAARVGDVLMVTHRRGGEPFAGVLLSIRRAGIDTAILLRGRLTKVAVEMWFKVYNRNVAGVEVVHRRKKRARRARLTYLRQSKHDVGDVQQYVFAWKKSRNVLTTRAKGAPGVAQRFEPKAKK
ncbi:translation protein SH3-like domain-containing protein [Coniochaeta sp. 2T2.1]|nr:translation protein SH3-like domain-containing protein [Coniochaeta sp. 2T2.1]